ncbi:MAG: BMP family lipoprotein, partial [Actinomycetota bacterium]
GYNYVEGVGFSFSPGVCKVAADFPNTDFAVVDGYTAYIKGCSKQPNVLDLNFAANESSYLVGIAAAMQAQKDGSTTVGFLGGQTGPLIGSFEGGYEAGVASVDPNIKVLVEYIGDSTQAFVNPTAGKALSEKMYTEGADVIYHAAGLSGAGLFQAAAEKSKYAIGVDSDQYLTASPDEQKWIITSALKRVDTATYDTIKAVKEGTFAPGVQNFSLANDGVGFATSNPTLLTSDMVDAMNAAKQKIIDGSITVPTAPVTS